MSGMRPRYRYFVLAVCVLWLAGDGVWLHARSRDDAAPPGQFSLHERVRTSFGDVAVEHVEQLADLTAQHPSGVAHGIQSLMPEDEDKVHIQVSVVLTNRGDRPVEFSPAQFRLVVDGSRAPLAVSSPNLQAGRLRPYTSIVGTLSFVMPRKSTALRLEYHDPGSTGLIRFDLGTIAGGGRREGTPKAHAH